MAQSPVAPWIRTRLRSAPLSAVALGLLVLVTSFLAGSFPRAVDTYETKGLRDSIASAGPPRSVVEILGSPPGLQAPQQRREEGLLPTTLRTQYEQVRAALPAPLRADPAESAYGAQTAQSKESTDPALPRPDGIAPQFTVSSQSGLDRHARVVEGRLPDGRGVTAGSRTAEAAVTVDTARTMKLRVGSVVPLTAVEGHRLSVRVSGIVEPLRPRGSYWSYSSALRTPGLLTAPSNTPYNTKYYWHASLLIAPEAGPFLLGLDAGPQTYWRIAPDPAAVTIHDLPALQGAVASLEGGPALTTMRDITSSEAEAGTELDQSLDAFDGLRSAVSPIVAVAVFGIGTVAGIVLLMAQGLAAARRHAELALLRARGGSVPMIAGRLCAESAVVAVPAAALGHLLAVLALPQGQPLPSAPASAVVAVVACAALPVRAALAHRRPQVHGGRTDLITARPSRRRTVAELCLLVLAVGAVVALRRRGAGSGGSDELVSAAPVLVGVIAALALVRLYPLPLRLAARPLARARGALGFLATARAGRGSAAQALPLLALLTALTTAAFGGSVLAGVADARDRAALLSVGADARIEARSGALPAELPQQVREIDGVEDVTAFHIDYSLELPDNETVPMIAVDPESYAELTRRTGLGALTAEQLTRTPAARADLGDSDDSPGTDGAPRRGPLLSAITDPTVAARLGTGPHTFGGPLGAFTLQVTETRETTPALPDQPFVLVDLGQLPKARPTALLATGTALDTAALGRVADRAGAGTELLLRGKERAAFTDSPLQSGAEQIYTAAVGAGAGFAVLALLLSLLQSAPERSALLARLRTMGLSTRQGRRLLILESLPQALLAACGGALVGLAAIELLAPGIRLDRIALTSGVVPDQLGGIQLRADSWSLLLPALGVVALAVGVAGAQAWWTARRTAATELRAGDSR